MRVLIVCSRRDYSPHTDYMAPFVYEQMKAIQALGAECRSVLVDDYSHALGIIRKAIQEFSPNIIHAHYGLCGLVAGVQRKVPVVTTYHGTDLHCRRIRIASQLSVLLSRRNIVVSRDLSRHLIKQKSIRIIPCGVNSNLLVPMDKEEARKKLGWDLNAKFVLFSKEFRNRAKNYPLAKAAIDEYNSRFANGSEAELLEFIGYSREQVLLLYNAVDCVLMTSDYEGSPQFIKEAMACNCPIVSVDVGDVKQVISGTKGCYIAERTPTDIARKLDLAMKFGKTDGRTVVLTDYDAIAIARKLLTLYNEIVSHE